MYNKPLEYLMSNNPDKVLSKQGVQIRKLINPLFRKLLPLTTKNKFHIVRKSIIPKDVPIIFAPTHGFRDDVALTLKTIDSHAYIVYGSMPDFYESIDGYALWCAGTILVDRKNKESRAAVKLKAERAIDLGANIVLFPEGVWNKTPNLIVQKLYPGIYDIAKNKKALIVPIATILEDGVCHAIMDEPFDITKFERQEGLNILRDKMATAKFELMEKYAHANRCDLEPINQYWNKYLEDLISTANGLYDYEIENTAQYKDKNEISEEEVFAPFKNVEYTSQNARVLVKAKRHY